MRLLIIILSVSFYASCAQTPYSELDFISLSQLKSKDSLRFDLSGITTKDGNYYVIADKEWNNYIYQINFTKQHWYISNKFEFDGSLELDIEAIEAIDVLGSAFILINEKDGKVYKKKGADKIQEIKINYEKAGEKPDSWGNAGWEGLAIDPENDFLYLAKERQPRYILKVEVSSGEILDKFNIPETESNDFADSKFENGFLYLLERNGNYVTKVDAKTQKVIDKVSYKHICSMPEGKLYGPEKYGMAEALLMLKDEIWIGIDNNGKEVTPVAKKKFGMTGTAPAILKFKRPTGF